MLMLTGEGRVRALGKRLWGVVYGATPVFSINLDEANGVSIPFPATESPITSMREKIQLLVRDWTSRRPQGVREQEVCILCSPLGESSSCAAHTTAQFSAALCAIVIHFLSHPPATRSGAAMGGNCLPKWLTGLQKYRLILIATCMRA